MRRVPALALLALGLPVTALADIVVMRTGSRIACARATQELNRMRLELAGGGVLHVALDAVKRVETGAGRSSLRAPLIRAAGSRGTGASGGNSGDDGSIARSADGRFDPTASDRSLDGPIDPEVAYARAAAAGRAPALPTVVGAMAGVEPVPMGSQLRDASGPPELDAKRRAFAERARIGPGSAGALLGRGKPGSGSSAGLDGGRDAPRVPR